MENINSNKSIAGIGTRNITALDSELLMLLASISIFNGYQINSGGANGSDTSFEFGAKFSLDLIKNKINDQMINCQDALSIFLPWKGFNGRENTVENISLSDVESSIARQAMSIAEKHHSGWKHLPQAAKKLMTRNVFQVLGVDLQTPVKFVLCCTEDGVNKGEHTTNKTGGTGQAIRIATTHNIPVFNIKNTENRKRLSSWIDKELEKIKSLYYIDLKYELKKYIADYAPFKHVNNDLVDMIGNANANHVFVQGCNIFNTQGAGLAKAIGLKYPEAYEADKKTKKGDRKKLGTYSEAIIQKNNSIILNAYTQAQYGRENKLYADYEAIRKIFKLINDDHKGKHIICPKIGAGLANGCWITIANILKNELRDVQLTVVFDSKSRTQEKHIEQNSFDF